MLLYGSTVDMEVHVWYNELPEIWQQRTNNGFGGEESFDEGAKGHILNISCVYT